MAVGGKRVQALLGADDVTGGKRSVGGEAGGRWAWRRGELVGVFGGPPELAQTGQTNTGNEWAGTLGDVRMDVEERHFWSSTGL